LRALSRRAASLSLSSSSSSSLRFFSQRRYTCSGARSPRGCWKPAPTSSCPSTRREQHDTTT
jgi:hypothetical protein